MIKLGIFILPNYSIKRKILNKKKDIRKHFGKQKYLSHIPHCTVCVIYISENSINKIKKEMILKFKEKKYLKIEKFDIFFNDPITKGNTLIFKIKKNNFLNILQSEILKKLKKYRIKIKKRFNNKQMRDNFKKYGYPFVKRNWNPHFTVASISKFSSDKNYFEKFKLEKFSPLLQNINRIYFFQIKKNKHKFICTKKIF